MRELTDEAIEDIRLDVAYERMWDAMDVYWDIDPEDNTALAEMEIL